MTAESSSLDGHELRSQLSTRRMIDAAGELIAEGGYGAMTLASIGERAGYSRGLATSRFGSKAKVLEALVDRIVNHWTAQVLAPRISGLNGRESLLVTLQTMRDQCASDPSAMGVLYALMFESLGPNEELRRRFVAFHRQMRRNLANAVRRGLADGSITASCDPVREAGLIVGELRGLAYQWRLDPETVDAPDMFDYLIVTVRNRLTAPTAS